MRWSDDVLKSNFHRVKLPGPGDSQGARYSLAFFNQARSDTVIQGPLKKYPEIVSLHEYDLSILTTEPLFFRLVRNSSPKLWHAIS